MGENEKTQFDRFQALAKALVKVPKAEVSQRIADERAKRRLTKKTKL